ncbi:MAG: hypothetical protein HY275_11380, partial [Gemmatimonadetes bacterium]|nr:hypothetical protein [Gemmatimonadota bacterium]
YDAASLRVALRAVLEEANSVRRVRARDAVVQDRRRRTVRRAQRMLLLAAALVGLVFVLRTPNGMGGWRLGPLAATSLFTGLSLVGVSIVLLIRSPFRMPVGERIFRLVWLGVPGQLVFAWAGRVAREPAARASTQRLVATASTAALPRAPSSSATGDAVASGAAERSATGTTAPRARGPARDGDPAGAAPPERLEAIERRVEALERWRDSQR